MNELRAFLEGFLFCIAEGKVGDSGQTHDIIT